MNEIFPEASADSKRTESVCIYLIKRILVFSQPLNLILGYSLNITQPFYELPVGCLQQSIRSISLHTERTSTKWYNLSLYAGVKYNYLATEENLWHYVQKFPYLFQQLCQILWKSSLWGFFCCSFTIKDTEKRDKVWKKKYENRTSNTRRADIWQDGVTGHS